MDTALHKASYHRFALKHTFRVVKLYGTYPLKASWIPDMMFAVFSQNCRSVVFKKKKKKE